MVFFLQLNYKYSFRNPIYILLYIRWHINLKRNLGITISSVHIFQVCKISVTDFQLLNFCYLITFASHSTVRYIIKVRHCGFLLYSGVLTFCLIFNLTWCGNYVKYNDLTGNNREVLSVIRNLMLLLNIILGIAAYIQIQWS